MADCSQVDYFGL